VITIIDCGIGNIASVLNMVRKAGGSARISGARADVETASKLILPGVGAFDHGVRKLRELELFEAIKTRATAGIPLLGICLGMQLLAKKSDEGELEGFGLINAHIKRFSFPAASQHRVPHVGWNLVRVVKPNPLIDSTLEQRFYFTHSYHAVCTVEREILALTDYGGAFVSAFSRDHIYGVQFHPEKSHRFGLTMIKRFVEL
jgi:imidazole glycerol-phosphate synthase subunit HisH